MDSTTITVAVVTAVLGVGAGYVIRLQIGLRQKSSLEKKIEDKLDAAREKVAQLKKEGEKDADDRRQQIIDLEKKVSEREDKLDAKAEKFEKDQEGFKQDQETIEKERETLKVAQEEEAKKLEEISGLTKEQATERAVKLAEESNQEDILRRMHKLESEGEKQLADKAREIMTTAMQRFGASQVDDIMTSHIDVPNEKVIGRIIGKEGRNIQHLERLTGCEIVIDSENPNTIMVSCFSPLRRQVAKSAIESLVKDGRIHPGRIEGVIEEAKKAINEDIRKAGEEALYELGIIDFPEKLVHLVGRLKYRTSYGQNMLRHSVEVAHIARMLAEELGADIELAKKAALLHDIGKAIDHDVVGSHVEVGDKIMKKFGLDERIIDAANPHDEGYGGRMVEAMIVQVADAISAARPGARRESLEQYIKRMEDLENIATSYDGVEKCYAIHAGREVRVFVYPKQVDDLQAAKIAQQIAKQIEHELQYPGDVKVNVIRETRTEATAH